MKEIRFAGFGGQGIIRSAIILGRAATIYDNKFATMNQSFGPEARGGACTSEIIVSEDRILYPYVTESDIIVAMSQEGYDTYIHTIRKGGVLIVDSALIKLKEDESRLSSLKIYSVPMTRTAEELGNRIVANVVMLGFLTQITDIVSVEAMRKAVPESVPPRYIDLNLKAFEKGYNYKLEN